MLAPIKLNALITSLLLTGGAAMAQNGAPPPRYINPMDIPLELSGNFMEPRNDHFHSGLDMRTQGREGIPVKAVAAGWISRIKISPWGYGKAVYIDHADGHTSVYGHLKELKGPVAEYCLNAQYKAKDFSIDVYPEKGAVEVKQGEVIALSGNTGGSGGPHLHFEIRRTRDQRALDPEAHGFTVKDKTPPEIRGIRIYALNDTSAAGPYPAQAKGYAAQGGSGRYTLKAGDTPAGYGTVGLAIHALDRYDNSSGKFGVRKIELLVDSVPTFSTHFNEVDFDHNRYCNAHMDYSLYKDGKMEYHRCYKLPNNKLKIYGRERPQGRIVLEPGIEKHVKFIVTDANGNVSELEFLMKGATLEEVAAWPQPKIDGSLFRYDSANVLNEEGVLLKLPPLALYDDTYVRYERRKAPAKAVAPLHVLHDHLTPIHLNSQLSIDVPDLPEALRSKALIVRVDQAGTPTAVGGTHGDGKITTQVKAFGRYTVMVDTVPPTISNVDLRADMKGRDSFNIKVQDDLSGIGTYKGYINGEWVLLEYEPKLKLLTHHFDKHTQQPGEKEFKLDLTDDRGNRKSWSMKFTR
jgi:murein DD-endopeptidase MepM/ murein hydrolase activator NlpD